MIIQTRYSGFQLLLESSFRSALDSFTAGAAGPVLPTFLSIIFQFPPIPIPRGPASLKSIWLLDYGTNYVIKFCLRPSFSGEEFSVWKGRYYNSYYIECSEEIYFGRGNVWQFPSFRVVSKNKIVDQFMNNFNSWLAMAQIILFLCFAYTK